MLDGRFVCTLEMPYSRLFPLEENEIRDFVISKRPTLRHKNFNIAL